MFGKLTNKSLIATGLLVLIFIAGHINFTSTENSPNLSPPSWNHWFGTDLTGADIFIKSINALAIEILTLLIVLPIIYYIGLFIGILLSYFSNDRIREFLLNLIHYWVTLPVLLIALFLLILAGAGQANAIIIMIFVLLPTQSLYVYNQLETVKKEDFVIAKMSYGFSKTYIFIHHLFPNIKKGFTNYTLARMPEIIMMNLALNFLGLGVQPPNSSFGRMLFDGLSFMFSAWWMWLPSVVSICLIIFLATYLHERIGLIENGK